MFKILILSKLICLKPAYSYLPKWLVWAASFNYSLYLVCMTLIVLQIVFLFIKKFSWKFCSSIGVLNLIKSYVFFRLALFLPPEGRQMKHTILLLWTIPILRQHIYGLFPTHPPSQENTGKQCSDGKNKVLNVSKDGYFPKPPTQFFCWRNIGMMPYYYYSWSLAKVRDKRTPFSHSLQFSTHMAKVSEKIEYWGIVYLFSIFLDSFSISWILKINDHSRMVHFSSR